MCRSGRPFLLGVVHSQRLAERLERASRAPPVGWGRGFCLAHARVSEVERPPTHRLLPRTALGVSSSFLSPPRKDTNSTPSRAAAPAPRARRAVRAPVGDAAAPFRWRTGSMDGRGSRRSLVGTSRLVPQCHGWRRSSRRMRSLGSSCAPLGGGLHHTRGPSTAQHDRPAPPVRRVALRADRRAMRWSWPCAAAQSRARCRLRAGRVAGVEHAETARVRHWAEPRPCVSPRRRVADLHNRVRTPTP